MTIVSVFQRFVSRDASLFNGDAVYSWVVDSETRRQGTTGYETNNINLNNNNNSNEGEETNDGQTATKINGRVCWRVFNLTALTMMILIG